MTHPGKNGKRIGKNEREVWAYIYTYIYLFPKFPFFLTWFFSFCFGPFFVGVCIRRIGKWKITIPAPRWRTVTGARSGPRWRGFLPISADGEPRPGSVAQHAVAKAISCVTWPKLRQEQKTKPRDKAPQRAAVARRSLLKYVAACDQGPRCRASVGP